jgi:hypothetical protein
MLVPPVLASAAVTVRTIGSPTPAILRLEAMVSEVGS